MTDGMPRALPKYVTAERGPDGRVRIYFRRDKKSSRIPMPDPRHAAAFDRAYAKALAGLPDSATGARSGTLAWLVARYKESGHWATLKPSTRRMRDNILKRLVTEAGTVPYAAIRPKHIREGMDRRAVNAANNFRKVLSQMFAWAVSVELMDSNPCAPVKPNRVITDGHKPWTRADIERYWNRWPLGTMERLAMDLMIYTGLRRGDAIRAGRQHVTDGVLSIRMEKTGRWVHVPILPPLQVSMDATKSGALAFITTARGQSFTSPASFGNWFRDACEKAGVDVRAHGLRKAGATIAADNGASAHQLMAMYGWTNLKQAEVYTKSANQKRLAVGSAERIANAFSPNDNPVRGKSRKTK